MPRYLIYQRCPTSARFSPALYADMPVIKHGRIVRSDSVGPRVAGDPVEITDDALTLDQAAALHPFAPATPEIHTGPDQAEPGRTATALIDSPAAWTDVLAERQRQIAVEGWTPEHDAAYPMGKLAQAASVYARNAGAPLWGNPPTGWPFSPEWWKPSTPRRDLVKAAALLLAEIERLDRAAETLQVERGHLHRRLRSMRGGEIGEIE